MSNAQCAMAPVASGAAIALFAYCRVEHTRRTVNALLRNRFASESPLIVFADAARSGRAAVGVARVRSYLDTISGFRSITVHHRPRNYGLARSITEGVSEVLQQHDRVIVLEDDMVTSPHFLTYMNQGLALYADDRRVASIHGYVYPVKEPLPETFFLLGADCWGWATWRRAWACFNPDGRHLLEELRRRGLLREFDFNGAYPYSRMLEAQVLGANDSWAVRWYASTFLAGKLTLYPGRSLVRNIGNDSTGTHCPESTWFDGRLSETPVQVGGIAVEPSHRGRQAIETYFRERQVPFHRRLVDRLRAIATFGRG